MGKGQGTGDGKGAMNPSAPPPYGGQTTFGQPLGQQQHTNVVYQTTNPQPVIIGNQNTRPAYRDKSERIAVPAMPMPAAVVCCIFNFLIPGFGTICAGFSSFCCSRNEDIDMAGRFVSCLIGWGIGCAQIITFLFCFIGWFWSCAWGVFFIGMSAEYYHNSRIAADGGYINRPGANGAVISTVVVNQPNQTQAFTYNQQPVAPPPYAPPAAGQKTDPAYPPPPAYPY